MPQRRPLPAGRGNTVVAVGQVGNSWQPVGNLRSEPESFQHPRSDGRWSASAQQGAPDELVGRAKLNSGVSTYSGLSQPAVGRVGNLVGNLRPIVIQPVGRRSTTWNLHIRSRFIHSLWGGFRTFLTARTVPGGTGFSRWRRAKLDCVGTNADAFLSLRSSAVRRLNHESNRSVIHEFHFHMSLKDSGGHRQST